MKNKKPNKDNIELVVLLDRSGSMEKIKSDMENGLNNYIKKQKEDFPKTKFTFVQFDTEYEILLNAVDIKSVKRLKLEPRGCTALLDAIGQTINTVKSRINDLKTKPQLLFVVVTDGLENSSHEFNKKQVLDMIKAQQDQKWDFVFLGANQDAIAEGGSIGINVGSTLTYAPTKKGVRNAFSSLCCYTQSYGATGQANFTDQDRKEQE